jgi:flagellar motor switch protein FliM
MPASGRCTRSVDAPYGDQLLGGFAGPQADTPRAARVQEIDFRRPTKFPREVVRRLEHAHDSFCRTASSALSAELRTSFELSVAGSEQLPYGTAMAEANQDCLLGVLGLEPLGTELALMVEMPLALRLVDRLLGGGGKVRDAVGASLTDLEVAIVRRAVKSLVEPLSATWLDLADIAIELGAMQTSPMAFQLVPPSEPVLIIALEARIDGLISQLSLCIPYRSVEQRIERFEHRHFESDHVDKSVAERMRSAIAGIDVELRAEVGAITLRLDEVLALDVGDVIRLRRPVAKGVVVRAGDVPTYVGTPGRNGNARAVQMRSRWEPGL